MFELPAERTPDRIGLIARWVPRIAVSVAFLGLGPLRFSDPFWIRIFQQIGSASALFPGILLGIIVAIGINARTS